MKALTKNPQQSLSDMSIEVDVQVADEADDLPASNKIADWVTLAVASVLKDDTPSELTVRIVDTEEMKALNQTYRHKEGVTNVLSFPVEADLPMEPRLLGDVVICADVVRREAIEQHKPPESHWAHLVIHGTLHLLGFDHINENDAAVMEKREIQLLHQLGYANPYEVTTDS